MRDFFGNAINQGALTMRATKTIEHGISINDTVMGYNWTSGFGRYMRGVVVGFSNDGKRFKAVVRWNNGERTNVEPADFEKLEN